MSRTYTHNTGTYGESVIRRDVLTRTRRCRFCHHALSMSSRAHARTFSLDKVLWPACEVVEVEVVVISLSKYIEIDAVEAEEISRRETPQRSHLSGSLSLSLSLARARARLSPPLSPEAMNEGWSWCMYM